MTELPPAELTREQRREIGRFIQKQERAQMTARPLRTTRGGKFGADSDGRVYARDKHGAVIRVALGTFQDANGRKVEQAVRITKLGKKGRKASKRERRRETR